MVDTVVSQFFETSLIKIFFQGEEICVALQTHINDVMLRRYSKAQPPATRSTQDDSSHSVNPPSLDIHEKCVQELSKAMEESQKTADKVSKLLNEKLADLFFYSLH